MCSGTKTARLPAISALMARTDTKQRGFPCWRLAAASAAAAILPFAAATALRAAESSYSSIAEKDCRRLSVLRIEGGEYAVSRVCAGRGGYKVFIDEEDLRETLTVGRTMRQATKEPAATDRFGAFNGYEDKVEWRSGRDGKPYALIVGWSFANNDDPDKAGRPKSVRLLVVLRLPPGPVCKVAYIDRAANQRRQRTRPQSRRRDRARLQMRQRSGTVGRQKRTSGQRGTRRNGAWQGQAVASAAITYPCVDCTVCRPATSSSALRTRDRLSRAARCARSRAGRRGRFWRGNPCP